MPLGLVGLNLGFGDGQAGPCMGRCMEGVVHGWCLWFGLVRLVILRSAGLRFTPSVKLNPTGVNTQAGKLFMKWTPGRNIQQPDLFSLMPIIEHEIFLTQEHQ